MSTGYSKLNRNISNRKALLRDLVTDLIVNESIETTLVKAKETQRLIERMVTKAKKGNDLTAIRQVAKVVRFEYVEFKEEKNKDGDVYNVGTTLAIQKLFNEIAPKFKDINGGYTRVLKTGPRKGDATKMAIIEFTYLRDKTKK